VTYAPDSNVTMQVGDAMTFLTDEPWPNGTEFAFGASPPKRRAAMSFQDLNKAEADAKPATDNKAQEISVRLELAHSMLRNAHEIDLHHLKEISQFVMTGRLPKPKETPPNP